MPYIYIFFNNKTIPRYISAKPVNTSHTSHTATYRNLCHDMPKLTPQHSVTHSSTI